MKILRFKNLILKNSKKLEGSGFKVQCLYINKKRERFQGSDRLNSNENAVESPILFCMVG
eukprot:snap_masked-scaffold_15-processed-gene-10.37-mRNA-1 protein AED:1.00 eAED:1.00 QI:0/0/0/0/1/1/2/0/59